MKSSTDLASRRRASHAVCCAATVAAALVLPACSGPKPAGAAAARTAANPKAAPSGNATAEEVAKELRGAVSCPARAATPAPPAGAPVADVVGIRPGMTYDEAANFVMCDNPLLVVDASARGGFQIETYGQKIRQGFMAHFAKPRVAKTSKEIMEEMRLSNMDRMTNSTGEPPKPGSIEYGVSTIGMPGQERVVTVARREWFGGGTSPTIESIAQSLTAKYGAPTEMRNDQKERYIRWVYDPAGQRIATTGPAYSQCYGRADPGGGVNITSDCGVVVTAQVARLAENEGLARYLQVGAVDHATGYRAIEATEEQLRQQDKVRKEQELKKAAQTAAKPKM